MVSDRDCINLSDIAYLELDVNKYRDILLHDIFFEKTVEGKYRPRDEFKNSQDSTVKKFMGQLKAFPHYYYPTLANYKLIDSDSSFCSGYYGMACINNVGEVIIANQGTSGFLDYINDLEMVAGEVPLQAPTAFDFYSKAISAANGYNNFSNITLTGHSLGGSLATFQMLKFYGDGYLKQVKTFEEYGILWCIQVPAKLGISGCVDLTKIGLHKNYIKHHKSWKKIKTAYRNTFDFVANTSMHIGRVVQLNKAGSWNLNVDPDHSLNTYKIWILDNNGNIIPGQVDNKNLEKLNKLDPGSSAERNLLTLNRKELTRQVMAEKHKLEEKQIEALTKAYRMYA